MRLAFVGTPEAALPALDAIVASTHDVAAVLTRPDARQGRGRSLSKSPVAEHAEGLGIPVLKPTALRDAGVAQQGVQAQAAVQTQLDEDAGGGDASAEVPQGFAGCFGDHDATHS